MPKGGCSAWSSISSRFVSGGRSARLGVGGQVERLDPPALERVVFEHQLEQFGLACFGVAYAGLEAGAVTVTGHWVSSPRYTPRWTSAS